MKGPGESPRRVPNQSPSVFRVPEAGLKKALCSPPALAPLMQSGEGGGPQLEAGSMAPAGHTPLGTPGGAQTWLTHLGSGYLGAACLGLSEGLGRQSKRRGSVPRERPGLSVNVKRLGLEPQQQDEVLSAGSLL